MGNNAASNILKVFVLKSCAKYGLDPVPDLDPEPGTEPKFFQSRNRNRNKWLPGTVPQNCFIMFIILNLLRSSWTSQYRKHS